MKKIVIIGANDFQNQLILKAKSLGYETHVFAWQCGDVGEFTADYFYPVSIIEKEEILEKCCEIKPCGICSIASDLATLTVNYVANALGLPCNSMECTEISTNKYSMREAFKRGGVSVPQFLKCDKSFTVSMVEGFNFPCIVKPTDRSGSRAITKVNSLSEIEAAVAAAVEQSFEKMAIVEEYIEGDEYSCECITQNGNHHFLAFTKKFTTGAPHFIETGHIQPSDIPPEYQDKIINQIFKALDALKIQNSASHTEFKLKPNGEIGIIEIGARMGGDCIGSDLVYLSTGYDFVKMVIDVACKNELDLNKNKSASCAAIKFLFTKQDIDKLYDLQAKYGDIIYRISNIEEPHDVVDSSSRLGYFIVLSDSKEKVIDILKQ